MRANDLDLAAESVNIRVPGKVVKWFDDRSTDGIKSKR
jgi:hypothetical protein